ncbi:1277_t:CDS:2, partial [Acaulospora morrowiae]
PMVDSPSALVGDKIYFFGGRVPDSNRIFRYINQILLLDLSVNFYVDNPSWANLSSFPYGISSAAAAVDDFGAVFLFGGIKENLTTHVVNDNTTSLLYKFNSISASILPPVFSGTPPPNRRATTMIFVKSKGQMWIFGGRQDIFMGLNITLFNDVILFNPKLLSWDFHEILPDGPKPRGHHTATLLKNGIIVILGGVENQNETKPIDMNLIYLYDTNTNTWSSKQASGSLVESRSGHSAVLTGDDKIIIYGGWKSWRENYTTPTPLLSILDTSTYTWSIPSITGDSPPLAYHAAHLYNNCMILAFGNITNFNGPPNDTTNKVYILDITSFTWVSQYPVNNTIPSKPIQDNNSNKIPIILGVVIPIKSYTRYSLF